MPTIDKTVTSPVTVSRAFAFLSDFTNTERWDPGTVRTVRLCGDRGVGTEYVNTSRFLGRETNLRYVVTEYEQDARICLRGENDSVIAHDTMTFTRAAEGGTSVRYEARFVMKGWAKLVGPFLTPAFRRLGREGARKMHETLQLLEPAD